MIYNVKEYVQQEKERLADFLLKYNFPCTLLIFQVGDNPASNSYIKGKMKDAAEIGINVILEKHDEQWYLDVFNEVGAEWERLKNLVESADGVIVQLPIENRGIEMMLCNFLTPENDVDGFLKNTLYEPCTPAGILEIYEHYAMQKFSTLEGVNYYRDMSFLVLGQGELVGKPLAKMLIDKGATVYSYNSKSRKNLIGDAPIVDVVITAVGIKNIYDIEDFERNCPDLIIDAGTAVDEHGKLCGDVNKLLYEDKHVKITPVPGGVGLMTRLKLMKNTIEATVRKRVGSDAPLRFLLLKQELDKRW